ncbi:MAG: sulfite exporter TauE/SafE family protein, partial [Alphaproteobacteria bacterium]|nr:sulfite exporter TauE/SafE family protein [Alphaproteobacteria bacterium]
MTLIFILIIFIAFFTQSMIGFASGLISVPLLSLFMPVQ